MCKDSQEPGKLNPGLLYLLIFLPSMVAHPGGLEGAPELYHYMYFAEKSLWRQIGQNARIRLLIQLLLTLPSTPLH